MNMRIGFAKLGLKTYFNKDAGCQGYNHELLSIFKIFEDRGHECVMLTVNDKYELYKEYKKLDFIFVFNGPLSIKKREEQKMVMLLNYTHNVYDILNDNPDIPYIYFWTDPRYDITKIKVVRQPNIILSQEKEYYGHLDKIILYGKQRRKKQIKYKMFSILMNKTKDARTKKMVDIYNQLSKTHPIGIIGDFKELNGSPIEQTKIQDYLDTVEYCINVGKKSNWVSQKYWEMSLSNVICFQSNYDDDCLLMEKDDLRRINDWLDIEINLGQIEQKKDLFLTQLQYELKDEYFSGDFIYSVIKEKICSINCQTS